MNKYAPVFRNHQATVYIGDTSRATANAALIAAAPDLLAALEFIVNDTPEPEGNAQVQPASCPEKSNG